MVFFFELENALRGTGNLPALFARNLRCQSVVMPASRLSSALSLGKNHTAITPN